MVMNDFLWDIIIFFGDAGSTLLCFMKNSGRVLLRFASMQVSLSYVVFSLSVIRNVFRVYEL